ncbi:MAG: helix-hairpin-helix domain-containing protein, partial [Victivallaceae bacterium]|nr:helix-hairpin-helix domain-containing protein [Victivallaceae bacterium]
ISSNLAVSIINYREKHPFENVIELARINGIGQKKISVLLDLVRCSEKEK